MAKRPIGATASGATVAQLRAQFRANAPATGPRNTIGGDFGIKINVDMSPVIDKLKLAMQVYGQEVANRALANALNHESSIFFTGLKRILVAQTSAKYGQVSKALKEKKARAGSLQYRIDAIDKPLPLKAFMRRAVAGKKPVIFAWNKQRTLQKAFVIRAGGELVPVKRVAKGHKAGSLRGLWGPIIPKEMLRPGEPSLAAIERDMPTRVMKRLDHELMQAVARAKAASGT